MESRLSKKRVGRSIAVAQQQCLRKENTRQIPTKSLVDLQALQRETFLWENVSQMDPSTYGLAKEEWK